MGEDVRRVSKKELEILRVLWEHDAPMSSNELFEELVNDHNWEPASMMTALAHMAAKGMVCCNRITRTNYYMALFSENEYKAKTSILEKVLSKLTRDFGTPLQGLLWTI